MIRLPFSDDSRPANRSVVPCALATLVLAACEPDASTNSGTGGEPAVWSVGQAPATTVGAVDGAPEYLLRDVKEVRLIEDGRVVIADGGTPPIRVYAADGTYQDGIGGTGEGPGEFLDINRLAIIEPDTMAAYDWRTFRLSRFLVDGSFVSTEQFIASEGRPEIYIGRFADGDHAFAWISAGALGSSTVVADSMQIGRFGPDGTLERVLHTTTGMRRFGRAPVPFSPYLRAEMVRDSIVFTDGLLPELHVLGSDGSIARTIPVAIERPDPEAAEQALRAELQREPDSDSERLMRWTVDDFEAVPDRDLLPHIATMLVDDRNRLWLKRYRPVTDNLWTGFPGGTGGEWIVIEPDGAVAATIRLPDGLFLADIRGDRLAGVTRDELEVERVVVYEISKP